MFEEFSIEALVDLPNLSTLILFNIWPLEEQLHIVCKLRTLSALDISTAFGTTGNGSYNDPNKVIGRELLQLALRQKYIPCLYIVAGYSGGKLTATDTSRYIGHKFGWNRCCSVRGD